MRWGKGGIQSVLLRMVRKEIHLKKTEKLFGGKEGLPGKGLTKGRSKSVGGRGCLLRSKG